MKKYCIPYDCTRQTLKIRTTGSDMSLSPTRKKDETRQDAHKGS
jgi:hypothetical protein